MPPGQGVVEAANQCREARVVGDIAFIESARDAERLRQRPPGGCPRNNHSRELKHRNHVALVHGFSLQQRAQQIDQQRKGQRANCRCHRHPEKLEAEL
eukprot:scaffold5289_cov60-Phaeocystis_antarctica.AAC.2